MIEIITTFGPEKAEPWRRLRLAVALGRVRTDATEQMNWLIDTENHISVLMQNAMKTRHSLTLSALVASISLLTGTVTAQEPSEGAEMDIFSAEMAALQAVDLFDSLSEADFAGDSYASAQETATQQETSPVLTTARGQTVAGAENAYQDQRSEIPVRIAQLGDTADVAPIPPVAETPRFSRESSDSNVRNSRMTTSELRQARALYRARQRTARLEYNLWMGYEPLRPNWNAVPMMTSRYSSRRIYVPMYVNPSR